jgi:hypothetical protein
MDVKKVGMARLLLAAPDLRGSAWMMESSAFLTLRQGSNLHGRMLLDITNLTNLTNFCILPEL